MTRLALVGLGFMGQTHFRLHQASPDVEFVAACDKLPERVAEQAVSLAGNLGGDPTPLDLSALQRFTSLDDLLATAEVDCVDLCTPTYLHADQAVRCLEAGKHVICEKPMALNVEQGQRMIDAARAAGRFLFIAQCIRFWPAYEVLAKMVADGSLGRLISAKFTRLSPTPAWSESGWLLDSDLSGGALLDLHIHDVDFIASLWGSPPAVSTVAANRFSVGDKVDHVFTQYLYDDFACVAEGGWAMPPGFPFQMAYQVLGEKGVLDFSTQHDPALVLYTINGERIIPEVEPGAGYARELEYFYGCLAGCRAPQRVTPEGALQSVRICLAERESARTGRAVVL
jgi:predicted dehydrogenase